MPLAKEIASYIDDVAPHAAQQRLVDMFFAGRTPMPFGVDTEFDEIDETIEEGF